MARFGTSPVILAGLSSAALAYTLLLPLGPDSGYATGVFPAMALIGLAFSLAYGPRNIEEQGLAAGLVNTSFQLGPALVLAVVTAVNDAYARPGIAPSALLDGLHAALVVPLAVSLIGIAAMAPGIRRNRRLRPPVPPARVS